MYAYYGQHYSGRELDYLLGEWHVGADKDSEVVVVLEDNLRLSDVKDVRAMAEVWFGPVVTVNAGRGHGLSARSDSHLRL